MNCCFRFIFPSVGRLMFERLRGNSFVVVVLLLLGAMGLVGVAKSVGVARSVGVVKSWVWFSVGVSLSFFSAGEGSLESVLFSAVTGSVTGSGCS